MLYRFDARFIISSLLQLGLLANFYTDPASRVIAVIYATLVVLNSGLLVVLAYQAFQRLRPGAAVVAALLAFPGLLLLVIALVVWSERL